ncbi:T9SS type A sorting domain-containing protein [Chryseobacterium paludis]|uniref:T9SS type A sorting domain-containing protein n=1 Tax=Chryseobacterium paludis TaxID=2956784 RepID=UPI0021C0F107|nr:T9SS type A sorting domain-containing protein [Chryseobacterium paludis]
MKKKLTSLLSLLIGFFGFSQTEVFFKYDEAGNQRYRGPDANAKQTSEILSKTESKTISLATAQVMDEKTFWKQIRLYPVPVNDLLTIDWTEETDGLIEDISLFQHSTVHWKFQQQNIPSLNRQLKINMSGYDWGVYILRFTLKDGRIFSKNITKR